MFKAVLYYLSIADEKTLHFSPLGAGQFLGRELQRVLENGRGVEFARFYVYETLLSEEDLSLSLDELPYLKEGVWRAPTSEEWEEFLEGVGLALEEKAL